MRGRPPETKGVRRLYRAALDPARFLYPRKGLVHHERSWFLSEAPKARPLFGVYAMASFAEDMLWRARFARRGRAPGFEDAARFFAETRRALQNVLSTVRARDRLTPKQAGSLRRVVGRLQRSAEGLLEKMEKVSRPHLTPTTVI